MRSGVCSPCNPCVRSKPVVSQLTCIGSSLAAYQSARGGRAVDSLAKHTTWGCSMRACGRHVQHAVVVTD
eukprot:15439009-Alexandrium_andersonii.AAC.1